MRGSRGGHLSNSNKKKLLQIAPSLGKQNVPMPTPHPHGIFFLDLRMHVYHSVQHRTTLSHVLSYSNSKCLSYIYDRVGATLNQYTSIPIKVEVGNPVKHFIRKKALVATSLL